MVLVDQVKPHFMPRKLFRVKIPPCILGTSCPRLPARAVFRGLLVTRGNGGSKVHRKKEIGIKGLGRAY